MVILKTVVHIRYNHSNSNIHKIQHCGVDISLLYVFWWHGCLWRANVTKFVSSEADNSWLNALRHKGLQVLTIPEVACPLGNKELQLHRHHHWAATRFPVTDYKNGNFKLSKFLYIWIYLQACMVWANSLCGKGNWKPVVGLPSIKNRFLCPNYR